MASRSLDDLRPDVRAKALAFLDETKACGIDVLIYCTLRSNDEQSNLYASGRTKRGAILTNARAGQSAHNPDENGFSRAFDCVPMLHGKPQWANDALIERMGVCGEAVGLIWSGRWRGRLREKLHFEGAKL